MLRVVQNRSSASAKSYYSHARYYGEGQELAGEWGGHTAQLLGLQGLIEVKDFEALCDNLDPRSGSPLTPRTRFYRSVGYDFNFHVPKGLSLAFALNGDRRIVDIFRQSVNETMAELEQEAQTRVRQGGQQADRTTGNLVWGTFIHTTARPIEGEPDPHLHAHCFVFNITFDREEQRYKAVQFRGLKRDARYWEARFHARLAKRVRQELGYGIERKNRSWDVAGIPESLQKKFSRRTEEIEEIARRENLTPDEKAQLGAKTRQTKNGDPSFAELQQAWNERLSDEERKCLRALPLSEESTETMVGPRSTAEAVREALLHSFEREAVVQERTVLGEALRLGAGYVDVHKVEADAMRQGLIVRTIDGRRWATLPKVLQEEADVLEFARNSKGHVEPLNLDWKFERDWLSDEQRQAIGKLITSRDRVQLILGGAGTGKTTLMQEAVEAIQAGGRQVFTFAPSAEASRTVLRDEGFTSASTVAELLVNTKLQDQLDRQVIWIDEAGLLGTRTLKKVCDLAERKQARLILSGDWKRQHGSVERGGVLALLDRYAGIAPIQIETIRRQRGTYKEAVSHMAQGNLGHGFDRLDELGWVHELLDDERNACLARDYADSLAKGESSLVVSPTHREAEQLVQAIRHELRQRASKDGKKLLATEETEIEVLVPLHLTEAERRDAAFYRAGDVIRFHKQGRGYRNGARLKLGENLPAELAPQADRFTVFRPGKLRLSRGDRIRITANGYTADQKHRLNTGAVYDVARVEQSGDIRLTNGWTIGADFGHLAQGWVVTSHASQGRTVDRVFVAESAESYAAADARQFYVSVSRGRKRADIYTDSKAELRDQIQDARPELTASELVDHQREQVRLHQLQQRAAVRGHQHEKLQHAELSYAR